MAFHTMHTDSTPSKNLEPYILRALALKKDQSPRDIAKYVYASDLRKYGKLDKSYETTIRKALKRMHKRGLVTYKKAKNEKDTIAYYYSLSFKGSILVLRYLTKCIASKDALKALTNKKITEEFKKGLYDNFNITLDNPDVKIEDRIITIDDKNVNIIIDLDRKRGILDNGYLLQALLLIDKNGIYTIDYNSISDSRVLFTLDELYAMSDKTKRYLSNEFGIKLRLLNKAKIEKDDNLIVISYDSNKIRIEIDDTVRINVKNRVKELIIKEDKVYEMHDYILDYQSVNPFFNIYNESLKNHVENLTDFEDFILPWLALYKSIIIDGILHGLDNGMIDEYPIDALIIEASILSIKDHIEFYFRYKRSYVLLFLCVVVDELLHRILIDSENTTLYYPSLYDKKSIDEYILTSLLDSIFIMLTESMRNNILRKYKSYIESFKESTDIYYLHPTLIKILIISDLLSNIIDDSDTCRLLKELSSPIHYKIREVMLR